MPYIKVISIRNSVAGCLKYIANPDKTEGRLYISSLNCSEDISIAEQEFCLTYQHYSHKNFYAPVSDNGKSPVKALHIISPLRQENVLPMLLIKSVWSGYNLFLEKIFKRLFVPIPIASISIIIFVCVPMIWTELSSTAIKNLLNVFGKFPMIFAKITGFVKWKS